MSLKRRMSGKYPLVMATGAMALVLGFTAQSRADALKVDGQWITNGVVVEKIEDGKIVYSVKGTQTEDPIFKVEGLRLDAYPDLADAQKAMAENKPADAVRMLQRMIGNKPRETWARQYAEKTLMQALDQANRPTEVVLTYLKLANEQAPVDYLKTPPTGSLTRATDTVKKDIRARLTTALVRLPEDAKPGAQLLLKSLGDEPAKTPAATPSTPAATGGTSTPAATPGTTAPTTPSATPTTPTATPQAPAPATPSAPASGGPLTGATITDANGVVMPAGLPKEIPVAVPGVALYREGKYEEALKWVDDQLKTAQQNFSFFFYLRGLALYEIADKTNNQEMFMDAGVSFMKSAIYFPRDMYAGPAYLETARVYVKLGKLKQAKKLFAKAYERVLSEPGLEKKVEELQAALKDTSEAPAAGAKDNY